MNEPLSNRQQIADEILAALDAADRPLTIADLYSACPSADDRASVARVVSYLKKSLDVEVAGEVSPGEPGGMIGQGARAVSAYRRAFPAKDDPAPVSTEQRKASTAQAAPWMTSAPPAFAPIDQSTIVGVAVATEERQERAAQPPFSNEWAPDVAREIPAMGHGKTGDLMDLTLEGSVDDDDVAILIHGHEELMLAYADTRMSGDRIWSLMRQQYQALQEL